MSVETLDGFATPRLRSLLEHFADIDDPREPWRVAHPLAEVLLLVVCGTICDCDDYEGIADWGEANLPFLRRYLPYYYDVPGGRWLTILMNRIDPGLFSAAFSAWVRETWPDRPGLWPSMARPRAVAMTEPQAPRLYTWCRPSPRLPASYSARKRSPTSPANSRLFLYFWNALDRMEVSRTPWSRSTRSPPTPPSQALFWPRTPTISSP
jgi:hypothetical protein